MGYKDAVSVADFRKEVSDVIGRAHYSEELTLIERRGRPMAFVGSDRLFSAISKHYEMAEKLGVDPIEYIEALSGQIANQHARKATIEQRETA